MNNGESGNLWFCEMCAVDTEHLGGKCAVCGQKHDDVGSLVLTRNLGQAFVIDESITVRVIRVNATRAALRITAPKSCQIRRMELLPDDEMKR